ncbi:MAG TPA: FAD:protein FMN transferase, partial [Verrucomicrobiae bacterium]|nr:FAD:protein FMN transferase [Verrucomicrobiae bacterium]
LSVSAISGKYFELEGKILGHVIDPRTGWPAQTALLAGAVTELATDSDALSTAVLLASAKELAALEANVPGLRYLQVRAGAAPGCFSMTRHEL